MAVCVCRALPPRPLTQSRHTAALTATVTAAAGDFWHTRGTLPVEPLNDVVARLAAWRQPTLLLPGNHDQVSLGGEVHALTPLAASNPLIHAFDGEAPVLVPVGALHCTASLHLWIQGQAVSRHALPSF